MMKMFFMMLFFSIIFIKINKFYIQLFYQIFINFLIMLLLLIFLYSENYWMMISYILMIDYYSIGLIFLSLWIINLMIQTSNEYIYMKNYKDYLNLINLMMIFLFLCFSNMNLMLFFMFFESSLIPMFMLVFGWGYQIERISASMYLMLYTLVGSMPLFLGILIIFNNEYSMNFNMIYLMNYSWIIYFMMMVGFLIKMPMYFLHLWLPKAHVESPIIGSMMLAGVMLKLGSYGIMRLMLLFNMSMIWNKFIIILSLMGGIYSSLVCLYQIDMKLLVAYSSVVHMGLLMSGMMTMFMWGYKGGYFMMISHGLCSSGMFCLVNIIYTRMNSRNMFISKGLINMFPSLGLLWFLICSSNMSFPPSLNMWSEIFLINSLIMWNKYLIIILLFLLFFSASYTLYFYSYSQCGMFNSNKMFMNITINEFMLLLFHWLPLNYLFMFMI